MSKRPIVKTGMGATGKYFERAEFDSVWPFQFMVSVIGLFLVLFEGSLGQWTLFYGATPLLSLIFVYYIALHFEHILPIVAAVLMGLLSDLLFSDIIGARALGFMFVIFVLQYRRQRLLQGDFLEIWTDFSIVTSIVLLFQFTMFSAINLAVPSTTPILFQLGSTLIFFPIGYVVLFSITALLHRARVSR